MRRIEVEAFGSLDELSVTEGPDPTPGPGEVVVAVEAAGVNFVDALIVQGAYQFTPPLPHTPGTEAAGVVCAIGDGVHAVEVGQRVVALPSTGGYSSHVVVPESAAIPVPENISAGQAAGLVQSYATALYALTRRAHVAEGEWVAVLGAGGGVGLATTDLATALGARVIACASSAEKLSLATAAGAVATVDYEHEDVKTAIRERTDGRGADVVVDPIGGDKAEAALRSLRWDGRYLVIGFAAGAIPALPLNQVLLNSRSVLGVELGGLARRAPEEFSALVSEVMALVASGTVHPPEPTPFPLADAGEVLADLQHRRLAGKAVLVP